MFLQQLHAGGKREAERRGREERKIRQREGGREKKLGGRIEADQGGARERQSEEYDQNKFMYI